MQYFVGREGGVNDLKKILRSHPLIIDSWVTRMHRLSSKRYKLLISTVRKVLYSYPRLEISIQPNPTYSPTVLHPSEMAFFSSMLAFA